MEKYSKWTDGPTGVNPFVPFGQVDFSYARVILLLPIIVLKYLLYKLCTLLLGVLGDAFSLGYRIILAICGVTQIHEVAWDVKLQRQVETSAREESTNSGSLRIVLSNHVSYLDVFYFAYKYGSASRKVYFVTMVVDELNREVRFRLQNSWSYISQHFQTENSIEELLQFRKAVDALSPSDFVKKLEELNQGPPCTIVFFPEGIPSNGRGILQYAGSDAELKLLSRFVEENGIKVDVVALNYGIGSRRNTDRSFNPACHMDQFNSHFIGLLSQFSISFEAKYLVGCKDIFSNKFLSVRKNIANTIPGVIALGAKSMIDKKDFMKYWKKTQGY